MWWPTNRSNTLGRRRVPPRPVTTAVSWGRGRLEDMEVRGRYARCGAGMQ
jgi:hypothetical protein